MSFKKIEEAEQFINSLPIAHQWAVTDSIVEIEDNNYGKWIVKVYLEAKKKLGLS